MIWVLLGPLCCCSVYYWAVYFPRAWRDNSNQEINDIKIYLRRNLP
jgi:hypothetical protein